MLDLPICTKCVNEYMGIGTCYMHPINSQEAADARKHVLERNFRTTDPLANFARRNMATIDENVNHPKHYNMGKFEVIAVIEDWGLGFNLGSAVKYIARAHHKGNELEDLRKAEWYIGREIARLESNKQFT